MNQPQIIVNMSSQRDGYVFGLRPRSRVWLEEHFPDRARVSTVFIGLDAVRDHQSIDKSILRQVLSLVTGLSFDELHAVGGFQLINPATGQAVLNALPAYV